MHLFRRNVPFKLRQPRGRIAIGRRSPVTTWRQRPARRNFRAVRHRAALELTESEKSRKKHPHPVADLPQIIAYAAVRVKMRWPIASRRIFPSVQGHEGDFRGHKSISKDVEQGKILQGVRANLGLRALRDYALRDRHEFGRNFRRKIASSVASTSSAKRFVPMIQRIRCWISVFGTPALTFSAPSGRLRRKYTSPAPAQKDRRSR